MKKLFVLILAMFMIFASAALAEVAEPAVIETTEPMVDLTEVVISFGKLVLGFFAVWIAKTVIPPVKKWLDAKTTNEQRNMLYNFVANAVEAAEQIIVGKGKGAEKLQYVIDRVEEKGYTVDMDMIEAAVKRMNDMALLNLREIITLPEKEESEPSDEEIDEDAETQI